MNKVPKVLIFVVLLVVVGMVIAVRQGRHSSSPAGRLDLFQASMNFKITKRSLKRICRS